MAEPFWPEKSRDDGGADGPDDQHTHFVVLCMNIFSSYKTQCMVLDD